MQVTEMKTALEQILAEQTVPQKALLTFHKDGIAAVGELLEFMANDEIGIPPLQASALAVARDLDSWGPAEFPVIGDENRRVTIFLLESFDPEHFCICLADACESLAPA